MKPGDLFIGVIDLFAIVLPGSILAAVLLPSVGTDLQSILRLDSLSSEVSWWFPFVVTAYVLGHLAFMIGAYLDGTFYERLRKRRWPDAQYPAYRAATELRRKILGADFEAKFNSKADNSKEAVNTFQWAKSVLLVRCPAASAEIGRLEADSKFFRTMSCVFMVAAVAALVAFKRALPIQAAISFAFALLSAARYAGQRWKSTQRAYEYVLALAPLGVLSEKGIGGSAPAKDTDVEDGPHNN